MKFIYYLVIPCILISCKKSGSDLNVKSSAPVNKIGNPQNNINSGARLNTNFVNLNANGNGTYSGSGLLFNSILYRTGAYLTGEAVTSFDASIISTSSGAYLESSGPGFAIYFPTLGGLNVNFHSDFVAYKTAYDKAIKDGTSIPILNDYVKDDYTGSYSGNVQKGIVVRDQNSPSTFSIAPGSYQPIVYTSASTGSYVVLGYVVRNGYTLYFYGYSSTGYVQDVTAFDQNNQSVGVFSFYINGTVLTYGWHVSGTITLANSTAITIDDDIDGF